MFIGLPVNQAEIQFVLVPATLTTLGDVVYLMFATIMPSVTPEPSKSVTSELRVELNRGMVCPSPSRGDKVMFPAPS